MKTGMLLACLFIVAAGCLAYHNMLTAPFVFDDLTLILENARVIEPEPQTARP